MKHLVQVDATLRTLIEEVVQVLPTTSIIAIGGAVLDCYEFFRRGTEDLDLVVVAGPEAWQAFANSPRWYQEKNDPPFRWRCRNGGKIDVLPCQPGDESPLDLSDGFRLSRVGMAHLDLAAHEVPGLPENVRFAPVAAIALLKMVAWLDKRHERQRDLEDLKRILSRYEQDQDRLIDLWQARADLDCTLAEAGAFLLGQDMAAIASPAARVAVGRFVDCHRPEPDDDHSDPNAPFALFSWLERGFNEGTPPG